jgi:CRISPR-associated endonuclease/helicase Cas3
MKSLNEIFESAPNIADLLPDHANYLAHLPHEKLIGIVNPELLAEHVSLVCQQAKKLLNVNGYEEVFNRLIMGLLADTHFTENRKIYLGNWVKKLFVNAIVFHDFGKVNPCFQTRRMKNPIAEWKNPFEPQHGHSFPGTWLYIGYSSKEIFESTDMEDDDERLLLVMLTLIFSYSILRHHNNNLNEPFTKILELDFPGKWSSLHQYAEKYNFKFDDENITNLLKLSPEDFEREISTVFSSLISQNEFPLFALLRLNFSILTASDYIATGDYTYQSNVEDWGVLTTEKREMTIAAAREKLSYNAKAYELFESGNYNFQHPTDPSGFNLNTLRTEMAVELLCSINNHHSKRLFYLEAPTGGGKTNLSMLAVAELLQKNPEINKIFYVFPFTTLITQTHKSIKETLDLDDDDIALMHSRAGFQTLSDFKRFAQSEEKDAESTQDGIYGNEKRDFIQNQFVLYPFVLITHIRFFDILKSNRKEDIYLMHRLANSIIVLDELQSYNPAIWDKMLYLLDQYGHYFNIRFVLMSATLPRLDAIESVKKASGKLPKIEDLLPDAKRYFVNPNFKGRVVFKFDLLGAGGKDEITQNELAVTVLEKSRARSEQNEGRVFTIVEFIFKKSATGFKAIMDATMFFDEVFVLSGTILENRRREIIYFLKKNRKTPELKILLITTQVVEAGVDIDMDLGFKNISLIDSDEQLAGRVNRNVDKRNCEVFLFKMDDPTTLYSKDLRYKVTTELDPNFHAEILDCKNFGRLYAEVFAKIDKDNSRQFVEGFKTKYVPAIRKLDYPTVHKDFKLIDQETLSVFVPVRLPLEIINESGQLEVFFSITELQFLENGNAFSVKNKEVDGEKVWRLYLDMFKRKNTDFIRKKVGQKTMQGILSKFTFSLFSSPQNRERLVFFSNPEMSFENYFYLSRHTEVYSVESGLDEEILKNPSPLI